MWQLARRIDDQILGIIGLNVTRIIALQVTVVESSTKSLAMWLQTFALGRKKKQRNKDIHLRNVAGCSLQVGMFSREEYLYPC